MPGFTKLFYEIITSSIWSEADKTRIVWVTLLASSDALGVVRASVPGLAHIARVDHESCEKALQVLCSPDEYSRSTEFEGRRIEKVDGGWKILNYTKYRHARNEDERKAYMANYMREYRAKQAVNKSVSKSNGSLTTVNHGKPPLAHAEAEAEYKSTESVMSRSRRAKRTTDHRTTDWLSELKAAYTWVTDFDQQVIKAEQHLALPKCKGRQFTRTFFTAWLNRIDRPLGSAAQHQTKIELPWEDSM